MIDEKFVKEALLKYNYFPMQKSKNEELPSLFYTEEFTDEVCKKLEDITLRKGGYDHVSFSATRFNNVHRPLAIPHPLPYAHLSSHISKNWSEFKYIVDNKHSLIRPKKHKDGRIVVMTYDQARLKTQRYQDYSRGKKFIVHSDISNFYPSIYTHSIPWALLGIDVAKKNQSGGYANDLDEKQRMMKRNETVGIAIGPATSNIVSEIILAKIDERLSNKGYEFYRFIDDYTAFCTTYEKAEAFIRDLSELLTLYGLLLNIKKTHIKKLPKPTVDDWVADISSRLSQCNKVNDFYCVRMIDYAVDLQEKTKDGSILKFTVKSLISKSDAVARKAILDYSISLAFHYPILLPILDELLNNTFLKTDDKYCLSLLNILNECTINKSSDGIVWCLYYLNKYYAYNISEEIANNVIDTKDCLSILTLYCFDGYKEMVINYAKSIVDKGLFDIDSNWILLYQLYKDKKIDNPYSNVEHYKPLVSAKTEGKLLQKATNLLNHDAKAFDILKKDNISFLNLNSLDVIPFKSPSFMKKILSKFSTSIIKKVEASAL